MSKSNMILKDFDTTLNNEKCLYPYQSDRNGFYVRYDTSKLNPNSWQYNLMTSPNNGNDLGRSYGFVDWDFS